jgi:hypothetical protein
VSRDVSDAWRLTPAKRRQAARVLGFADAHNCVPVVVVGSTRLHLRERGGRFDCNQWDSDVERYDAQLLDIFMRYCRTCVRSARAGRAKQHLVDAGGER